MHETLPLLEPTDFPPLKRGQLDTLQINIGLRCNQACLHCHVNSNPYRKEKMSVDLIAQICRYLETGKVQTLDITGGAPEMHPEFRALVRFARALDIRVIDRCNLTILSEPGHEELSDFLAKEQVDVVASLPCYTEENVDQQRGKGTFDASIKGLRELNTLGYGKVSTGLILNLVYNPLGPYLPGAQEELSKEYKHHLFEHYGVEFNELLAICNMPIKRFGSTLISKKEFAPYMSLLKNAHRSENLEGVMCRSLVSVDWEGFLYDCDFNQMLGLGLNNNKKRMHLRDLMETDVTGRKIQVRDHCYACTAGQGSSCGGALS